MSRPTTPSTHSPKDIPFPSPARSSTHPIKPRHHIPHHPHRVHHHHHSHHAPDARVPQSAIQPSTSSPFGEFLAKTTSGLSDGTKTPPKRNEAALALREEEEKREREKVQWGEVERLRGKRTAVDEDLRTTLTSLSTLSTSTTRRLDYTYYSLLSSLSALTSTITELHKLSTSTTELSTQFTNDSTGLSSEVKSQISTAERGFKHQARRIEDLEMRMKRGREKVQALGGRLEVVRQGVERNGERDREGRKRVGRRLKMLWALLGCWGGMVFVFLVARHWPAGIDVRGSDLVEFGNRTWSTGDEVPTLPHMNNMSYWRERVEGRLTSASEESVPTRETARDDPVLRLFDEL